MSQDEPVYQVCDAEMHQLKRFVFWTVLGTFALALLALAFILTADSWMRHISFAAEKRFIRTHMNFALEYAFPAADPAVQAYLSQLGGELAAHQGLPEDAGLEVHFIKGDTVNAFATLGSHILVFEGLVKAVPDENTLAMVLAHEIAHIKHRDPIVSVGRTLALQVLLSGASNTGGIGSDAGYFTEQMAGNIYSRDQERAADESAIDALNAYYGHVWGAEQLFELLAKESGDDFQQDASETTRVDDWFSTHPALRSRKDYMSHITEKRGWRQGEPSPLPKVVVDFLNSKN